MSKLRHVWFHVVTKVFRTFLVHCGIVHTATIDIVRRSGLYHRLEQTFEFLGASVTGRLSRKKLYTTENQISKSVLLRKTKYSVYSLQLALWTTKKHNFRKKKEGLLAGETQVPRQLETTTDGCLLFKTFSVYTFSLFRWNTTFI